MFLVPVNFDGSFDGVSPELFCRFCAMYAVPEALPFCYIITAFLFTSVLCYITMEVGSSHFVPPVYCNNVVIDFFDGRVEPKLHFMVVGGVMVEFCHAIGK